MLGGESTLLGRGVANCMADGLAVNPGAEYTINWKGVSKMSTKSLAIVIAAGVMAIGIAAPALAGEKGNTLRAQDQIMVAEQKQADTSTGFVAKGVVPDADRTNDRTQLHDRKMDGTGDHQPDQLRDRDRDRSHDHIGAGSGGMGSGMRGPKR